MERAKKLGFVFNTGPGARVLPAPRDRTATVEPLPHDAAGYFDLSEDLGTEVRKEMMNALEAFGIHVETAHHEVATGQHEIDFQYADALRTADNAVTFKTTLKAVAASKGLYATFMPKPFFGINGSGMHTHQSLWDIKRGKNAFSDPKDSYGLSEIARQYIAGTLEHARGMIAVLAPLVNSYKRLVPGYEAPVYVGWARINRSALIRIPQSSKGQFNSVRIELRCPDPSSNPYLAFAAMLAAGLDGIDRKLTPPDPVEENLYHFDAAKLESRKIKQLPGTLREAIDELSKRRGHPRGARRPHLRALRRGQARGVGRVPDAGQRLGGRAVPRGVLTRSGALRPSAAGREAPPLESAGSARFGGNAADSISSPPAPRVDVPARPGPMGADCPHRPPPRRARRTGPARRRGGRSPRAARAALAVRHRRPAPRA